MDRSDLPFVGRRSSKSAAKVEEPEPTKVKNEHQTPGTSATANPAPTKVKNEHQTPGTSATANPAPPRPVPRHSGYLADQSSISDSDQDSSDEQSAEESTGRGEKPQPPRKRPRFSTSVQYPQSGSVKDEEESELGPENVVPGQLSDDDTENSESSCPSTSVEPSQPGSVNDEEVSEISDPENAVPGQLVAEIDYESEYEVDDSPEMPVVRSEYSALEIVHDGVAVPVTQINDATSCTCYGPEAHRRVSLELPPCVLPGEEAEWMISVHRVDSQPSVNHVRAEDDGTRRERQTFASGYREALLQAIEVFHRRNDSLETIFNVTLTSPLPNPEATPADEAINLVAEMSRSREMPQTSNTYNPEDAGQQGVGHVYSVNHPSISNSVNSTRDGN